MKNTNTLPNLTGISLKPQHYQEILSDLPKVGWFEVHPENYMGSGGLPHKFLSEIHQHYPLSMHGVGLSLGSAHGINHAHLDALKEVIDRHQPEQVSEHLAWSQYQHNYFNDLLPIPYTKEFLNVVIDNIHTVQNCLQQTILLENPSSYLAFSCSEISEPDFLNEIVKQTDCGLLLDVNNVYVSAHNQNFSTEDYLNHYPMTAVGEIHLAGHSEDKASKEKLLIDDHGSAIPEAVWELFRLTLKKLPQAVPVLIEWDTNIPELSTLLNEANKADNILLDTYER